MTAQQREHLRRLIREGNMWDALLQVFEEQAIHALEVQDEIAESETPQLSRIIALTAERLTSVRMGERIQAEAQRQESPPSEEGV